MSAIPPAEAPASVPQNVPGKSAPLWNPDEWGKVAQRYNSQVYALIIALGVPLMGWLVDDFYTKLVIASWWFALASLIYFWTEGREILDQIEEVGLIDQQQSDAQRRTMYALYFGVIAAIVIWVVVVAVYTGSHWPGTGWRDNTLSIFRSAVNTPLHYGIIEWALLVHTILVARWTTHILYALISAFLQATAGQRRLERQVKE